MEEEQIQLKRLQQLEVQVILQPQLLLKVMMEVTQAQHQVIILAVAVAAERLLLVVLLQELLLIHQGMEGMVCQTI